MQTPANKSSEVVSIPDVEQDIGKFRRRLLAWFARYRRDLPWRRTRDPYAIWVSEVMLQQTRAAVVVPYYERFLARFPNFKALAEAAEPDVLSHWAGLGYYYRARNLQKAARTMCDLGAFPTAYDAIRRLPGVGDYTAAAVTSICFDLPHPVVDGNVLRVLSRVLDDQTDIASTRGRQHFLAAAHEFLDRNQPGDFNQAMMELGATVCTREKPRCLICPVSALCRAQRNGTESELPVKLGPRRSVREKRLLLWVKHEESLLVWQRPPASRLMPGFWELPEPTHLPSATPGRKLGLFRHTITFHKYRFEIRQAPLPSDIGACQLIPLLELERLPLSTVFKKALRVMGTHQGGNPRAEASVASA